MASDSAYRPDPTDRLDTLFAWAVQTLDSKARQQLSVERLGPGQYIIDGRKVSLRAGSAAAGESGQLLVSEIGVGDGGSVPLSTYLAQASNVATSLHDVQAQAQKNMSNIVPLGEPVVTTQACLNDQVDDAADERCRSMMLACLEAGVSKKKKENTIIRI